jgi:hypothetical protein
LMMNLRWDSTSRSSMQANKTFLAKWGLVADKIPPVGQAPRFLTTEDMIHLHTAWC